MKKTFFSVLFIFAVLASAGAESPPKERLAPYIQVVKERGEDPLPFITEKLDSFDLIIFDDALHTAVEPFEFYQKLIGNEDFQKKVKYIFLEVVPINQQPALDAYLESASGDMEALYPAYQNDFSGTGWPYKTYFDLMEAVREVNSALPEDERFKVAAVNAPTYWGEIDTKKDLDFFRLSLAGNDYTMYKVISEYLDAFKSGKKGIFLTNTRHAYKGIKNKEGEYYWNCGTFFHRLNPGKAYSVRFHSVNLYFEGKKKPKTGRAKTTEGLEGLIVKWVRMEEGLWDSAFKAFGNRTVAFDMKNTPFGEAEYIGNHMLNAAGGQTMYDAYDALVFLAPLEEQRQTAMAGFIYTGEFKAELARRYRILYTAEQIEDMAGGSSPEALKKYIDARYVSKPEKIQPLVEKIGRIDEWERKR